MKILVALVFALVLAGCGDSSVTTGAGDVSLQRGKPAGTCGTFSSGCATDLNALCSAIDGAGSLKAKTEASLISKVNGADLKLIEGKTGDATGKLGDIQSTLEKLAGAIGTPKAKITQDDFDSISGALADAQVCVGG